MSHEIRSYYPFKFLDPQKTVENPINNYNWNSGINAVASAPSLNIYNPMQGTVDPIIIKIK